MPMPGAPIYTSQQTLFFRLGVELAPDIIPAAEELMKALVENLRKTLEAAWKNCEQQFIQHLGAVDKDVESAEHEFEKLQERLREILGSHNLQHITILDDMTRVRKELQAAEMDHATRQAVMEKISMRIKGTKREMRDKLEDDPVLTQLVQIIKIHDARLQELENAKKEGTAEPEMSQARENLARARIELAERREQISESAGGELLRSLNNQLAELTIQRTQWDRRMDHLRHQLDYARALLGRADDYERLSLRAKVARQTFEDALLLQSRVRRKGLPPRRRLIFPIPKPFPADLCGASLLAPCTARGLCYHSERSKESSFAHSLIWSDISPAAMKRSGIAVGSSALLAFVFMFQSYYYVSLLVSFFNIPVRLGHLFQRIASVYGRF
jgi:hypothetical protein